MKPPRKVVRARAVIAIVVAVCMPIGTASAKSGDLDLSYGRNGGAPGIRYGEEVMLHTVALGPGRSVTAIGTAYGGRAHRDGTPVVTRTTASGVLDRTFGTRGVTTSGVPRMHALEMAVAGDGTTAALGWRSFRGSDRTDTLIALMTRRGRADQSFGGKGYVLAAGPSGSFEPGNPTGVGFQPDGRLVVGIRWEQPIVGPTTLQRFKRDGSLDITFGRRGYGGYHPDANDVVHTTDILPDGRILTAGQYSGLHGEGIFIARFLADGLLDPTFGVAGIVRTPFPGQINVVGLAARDGAVTAVSSIKNGIAITRLAADGTPTAGPVSGPIPVPGGIGTEATTRRYTLGRDVHAQDVAFDTSGRLFVLTWNRSSLIDWHQAVTRFAPSGVDRSFGNRGTARIPESLWGEMRMVSTSEGLVAVGAAMSAVRFRP